MERSNLKLSATIKAQATFLRDDISVTEGPTGLWWVNKDDGGTKELWQALVEETQFNASQTYEWITGVPHPSKYFTGSIRIETARQIFEQISMNDLLEGQQGLGL